MLRTASESQELSFDWTLRRRDHGLQRLWQRGIGLAAASEIPCCNLNSTAHAQSRRQYQSAAVCDYGWQIRSNARCGAHRNRNSANKSHARRDAMQSVPRAARSPSPLRPRPQVATGVRSSSEAGKRCEWASRIGARLVKCGPGQANPSQLQQLLGEGSCRGLFFQSNRSALNNSASADPD